MISSQQQQQQLKQQEQERERLMIEWGKRNGIKWDDDMMEIHDFGESGGGRGVRAKRTIESGDLLVEVPLSLLIHSLPILSVLPPFEHIEVALKKLDSKQTICFQLIYERLIKDRSRWYGYLDCIPKEYNTTISYTDSEIEELTYPYYKNEAIKLRKEMLESYKQYKEILQSHLTLKTLTSHAFPEIKTSGGIKINANSLSGSSSDIRKSASLKSSSSSDIRKSGSINGGGIVGGAGGGSNRNSSSSDIKKSGSISSSSGTTIAPSSVISVVDQVHDDDHDEHQSHLGCPTNNGYEVVFHQNVLNDLVDLNLYMWAWGVIQTRTYYYNPRLDHQVSHSSKKQQQQQQHQHNSHHDKNDNACLVPLADLFNHNPSVKTTASYHPQDRCYRVYTNTRFEKGDQVYISYGLHNNSTLLHYYGFVIDNNNLDSIEIDDNTSLPQLRPSAYYHLPPKEQKEYERLIERKENILIQNGLFGGKYEVVNDPSMPFTWNYLSTLRVMMMTKSEIDTDLQNNIFHLDEPVSPQNNKRVSKFLVDLCDRHLLQLGSKRDLSTCKTHNQLMTSILLNNTITIFENARTYSLNLGQL